VSGQEVRAFGREVLRRRSDLGMTQEELGERAKLSAIFVGRVESGKMRRGPSLAMAFRIAKGLEVPLADMLGGGQKIGPMGLEAGRLVEALPKALREPAIRLLRGLTKEAPR
jgi:transcriptional regulator with XRE-family HTH domain